MGAPTEHRHVPGAQRNLLSIVHYPVFGGPHNELLRLGPRLEDCGWHLTALLPDEPGSGWERLRKGGVEVVRLALHRVRSSPDPRLQLGYPAGFVGDIVRLRRLIRRVGAHLVEVSGLLNPQAAVAARLEGRPVVWKLVDSRPPRPVRIALTLAVRNLADAILCTGRALVEGHGGERWLRAPVFVYYPPVDTRSFRPDLDRRAAARQRLGIPMDAPVVGTMSNLNPQKGVEHFIRAARIIQRQSPEARFLIVGERYPTHQAYSRMLEAEAQASRLTADRLLFAGGTDRPQDLYPAMDVKVVSSVPRSEGVPTAALEAQACGIPVVSAEVGAVAEAVQHGVTGFLVPARHPEALAAAVLELLCNPDLRARMGASARRLAVERHDVSRCLEVHLAAYEAALRRGAWGAA